MSKAVLLSIRPNWCKLIWAGMKTVEVRRTCPKLEAPFKVYIYCTGHDGWIMKSRRAGVQKMDSRVIGEFICDEIYKIDRDCNGFNFTAPSLDLPVYTLPENNDEERNAKREELITCMTDEQLSEYLGIHPGYGWHITELKIYDVPRPIRDFMCPCAKRYADADGKWHCKDADKMKNKNGSFENDGCNCTDLDRLSRPPQSLCYVEDAECTS